MELYRGTINYGAIKATLKSFADLCCALCCCRNTYGLLLMLVGVSVAVVVILRHYHASTGEQLGQVSFDWLRAGHVTTVTTSDWLLQGSSSNSSSALIVATIYFYFAAGPYVGNYKLRH